MRIRGVEVLVVLALMTSFAAAGSTTGEPNNGLETKYSASDFVKGWVNISIESEPLSSLFFDNFENSINIKSLLDLNKNLNYTCNPNDCKSANKQDIHAEQKRGKNPGVQVHGKQF